jgi:hypothetical protein
VRNSLTTRDTQSWHLSYLGKIPSLAVLAHFDRDEASVPINGEDLLPAPQSQGSVCRGAVAFMAGNVQADRVVYVVFNCVLLPSADCLPIDLGLVRFGPQVPRIARITAILRAPRLPRSSLFRGFVSDRPPLLPTRFLCHGIPSRPSGSVSPRALESKIQYRPQRTAGWCFFQTPTQ